MQRILMETRKFQSTLLMRGATRRARHSNGGMKHFNPRSSCEERLRTMSAIVALVHFNPRSSCEERPRRHLSSCHLAISIHAPHARSDPGLHMSPATLWHFNPRSSCEERPSLSLFLFILYRFQSTLLMRGATRKPHGQQGYRCNFNPRSSCEERLIFSQAISSCDYFNPRSSCEERPAG